MSKLEDNVNEILGIEKKSEVAIKDFEQPAPVPRVVDESKTGSLTTDNNLLDLAAITAPIKPIHNVMC